MLDIRMMPKKTSSISSESTTKRISYRILPVLLELEDFEEVVLYVSVVLILIMKKIPQKIVNIDVTSDTISS